MIMAVIISFRSSHSVRPIIVSYLSSSHFVGYLTLLRSASVRPSVVRSRVIAVLKVKSSEKGACFAPSRSLSRSSRRRRHGCCWCMMRGSLHCVSSPPVSMFCFVFCHELRLHFELCSCRMAYGKCQKCLTKYHD